MYFASLTIATLWVILFYIMVKIESEHGLESKSSKLLFFTLFFAGLFAILFYPDILSHQYAEEIGLFRFHLAQMSSFTNFAMGAGWIFIGPIIIPLTHHALMPSLVYYGTIFVSLLGYGLKKERGLALVLVLLLSISFVGMEYARRSTRDFQTKNELRSFLAKDDTDDKTFTSDHVCIDFTKMLIRRARKDGYRLYFYSTYLRGEKHARCEAYIVGEDEWVEVEPQTDEIIE